MPQRPCRPILVLTLALAVTLAAAAVPAAAQDADACPGDTPEATYARAAAFLAEGDMGMLATCFQPADRKKAAREMLDGAAIMVAMAEDEAMDARLDELLGAYALPDPIPDEGEADEAAIDAALDGADLTALIVDLADLLSAVSDSGSGMELGELADLTVDGDSASGTASGQPFEFVRVDGLWYLLPPG